MRSASSWVRDLSEPGEAIVITERGVVHTPPVCPRSRVTPRASSSTSISRAPTPLSTRFSVYKARLRMGEALAEKILREWPDHDIDVVIPIPETSRTALSAPRIRSRREVPGRAFIKNRYVARTFIMPGQTQRMRSVRRKLNAIGLEFEGKNVLLVDDSIRSGHHVAADRPAGARRRCAEGSTSRRRLLPFDTRTCTESTCR